MNIDYNDLMVLCTNKKKILVIGDIMLDEYVVGHKYRISDEAPVPILTTEKFEVCLGGSANVAVNINCLGGESILCGGIGSKDDGGFSNIRIINLLKDHNIPLDYIVSTGLKTTTKTRVIIKDQQVVRYDYEDPYIPTSSKKEIISILESMDFSNIDAIVVSDYNKGVISSELMSILLNAPVRLFIDPKPCHSDWYIHAFCMTPNMVEFNQMAHTNFDYSSSVEDIGRIGVDLAKELDISILIIKLGERGALCIYEGDFFVVPAFKIEVANTIGAGDTFISMLALALTNGIKLENSIYLANKAASISISKRYTGSCYLNELK